ncbi:MAG TPA: type II toxin-antitoxin system VapC family toxin [Flavipsychrobacter sp.]|nr:type II toxin-antitoxin system VapC family toxin [Flavipsychrobacter sp.]
MAIEVFLDANIILEAYLKRTRSRDASAILSLISENSVHGFTTPSAIQICIYFLEKEMPVKELSQLFISLLQYIEIIDTNRESMIAAFSSKATDLEDAILYHTAMSHNLDYFLTFDRKFAKNMQSVLPVITPSQFLETL